jgi:transposase
MKKNSTVRQSPKRAAARKEGPITIGMDLGDKTSRYCVLGADGEQWSEGSVATNKKAMAQKFSRMRRGRVALEVGTHSPWLSRLLSKLGFEVIVANARQVQLISARSRKNDRMDARLLARLARVDPELLRPIRHRSEQAQADLMTIRIRASLVEARTMLVNAARGFAKTMGERLPACDTDALGVEKLGTLPEGLRDTLQPLLEQVESLTEKIKESDTKIEQIARTQYPETELLRQVSGGGNVDRSDIHVDRGGSRPLPEEPGRGLLCRFTAQAK